LFVAAWQVPLWEALRASRDEQLAAIAEKSAKETRYHLQHAADWTVRLGDGTDESKGRMQRALDYLWPYTAEFFTDDDATRRPRRRAGAAAVVAAGCVGGVGAAGPGRGHAGGAATHAIPVARAAWSPQRAHGPSAGADAGPAARPPGCELVNDTVEPMSVATAAAPLTHDAAWAVLRTVPDPEIR
jgi:hypothetical protein